MTNITKFADASLVWARLDEGSIAQCYVESDDRDNTGFIYVRLADAVDAWHTACTRAKDAGEAEPSQPKRFLLEPKQVAATQDELLAQPELNIPPEERADIINEALQLAMSKIQPVMFELSAAANERWGKGSLRSMFAQIASLGALQGFVSGNLHLADPPPEILAVFSLTGNTVANSLVAEAQGAKTDVDVAPDETPPAGDKPS